MLKCFSINYNIGESCEWYIHLSRSIWSKACLARTGGDGDMRPRAPDYNNLPELANSTLSVIRVPFSSFKWCIGVATFFTVILRILSQTFLEGVLILTEDT